MANRVAVAWDSSTVRRPSADASAEIDDSVLTVTFARAGVYEVSVQASISDPNEIGLFLAGNHGAVLHADDSQLQVYPGAGAWWVRPALANDNLARDEPGSCGLTLWVEAEDAGDTFDVQLDAIGVETGSLHGDVVVSAEVSVKRLGDLYVEP